MLKILETFRLIINVMLIKKSVVFKNIVISFFFKLLYFYYQQRFSFLVDVIRSIEPYSNSCFLTLHFSLFFVKNPWTKIYNKIYCSFITIPNI